MKTLAIIGASYLQRPLVERARQMGLRTICFAWAEGAVCRDLCDVFYPVSIVEKEQILSICRDEHIDGICTIASDVAAPTVAYVANQMGLAGNDYEAALRANNKYLMRRALSAAGVDCPRYTMLMPGDSIDHCEPFLHLPLIVKPSDRSGSMAVTKVTDHAQLAGAIHEAQKASFRHEAMVEEYIEGREISVEMISCGGKHYALQITDKETTEAPHFVELAHHQPSDLPAVKQEEIFKTTSRALDALGLTTGASHSEYKITDSGRVVVMEIGGRMGGDFIGSDLVRLSTGYDFVQGVIEVALGETIHPQPQAIAHSGVYFLSGETPEVLSYIHNANTYQEIVCAEQTDSILHPLTCSGDRSGYFIYQADKRFDTLRGKTIMILGGGRYQLPLIRTARESGCRVLVIGWPGNFPGYALASKWYNVDIMDTDEVIRIAREEKIDGIVGCGSDFILPTIGRVVDALGLPGASYQSSIVASDKALMKQAFAVQDVRTAQFKKITSSEEALTAAQEMNYPVVLKIVDGSGSKGVTVCRNAQELKQAYQDNSALTHSPYMVVEQFIDGEEFGAQAYVCKGKLQFAMIHGDIVFHGKSGIPVGHYAPAMTDYAGLQKDVEEQLKRAIKALDIDNCAINADFILHEGKVYVLEIGARAGATCLPELVSECYGINYYEYLLRGACGLALPMISNISLSPALVYMLFSKQTGCVAALEKPEIPEIIAFELYPKIGEEVHAFRTAYDRIGHLVMRGKSMKELLKSFQNNIEGRSFVRLTEENLKTE